jgi:UDP-N-acetylmuramate--alanine ligase
MTLMLRRAGLDPSAIVGGVVDAWGGNVICGDGPHFVAEADESDGSLVLFHPRYSIITNIEEEHFGYYRDLQGILTTFAIFIENTLRNGRLVYNLDDANLSTLVQDYEGEVLSYSINRPADVYATNIILHDFRSSFDVHYGGRSLGRMELSIPGFHNVSNSLGALAVALQMGVPFEIAREAVRDYRGVQRRFEIKGMVDDILVVDDYAHHPTEVKATLLSARHIANGGRLVGVFQPHRFTRTKYLHKRFSDAFSSVDKLILTDIYSANEPAIEGVDGTIILQEVLGSGQEDVQYFPNWRDIPGFLSENVHAGDVVIVMGAGSISHVADELVRTLRGRKEQALAAAADGQ